MMKQSTAVVQAVTSVIPGRESYTWDVVKPFLPTILEIVLEGFMSGEVELSSESKRNEAYLRKYIPGLVNNHVRKDKRLNGGTEYVAKNPGSRQGAGDPQLKALRGLLSSITDPNDKAEIEAAIAQRQAELAPAKPAIDYSALPAHLRAKYAQQ